jgi:hypothetical protein
MQRLFGRTINVYFKGEDTIIGGILLDCNEEYIYIQSEQEVAIIPKQNIKFYTTPKFVSENCNINVPSDSSKILAPQIAPNAVQKEQVHPEQLSVWVDGVLIACIPIPPTFNLGVCSEEVLKVIWGNPDVQSVLRGRVQKQIEYIPGEARITTVEQSQQQTPEVTDGSFSMGPTGNNLTTQFVNPSEMVKRLNNLVKGSKT